MERQILYGKKTRELRCGRGWTQEHLAGAASLDVRTIQRVEADQTRDSETLLSIAAALDVPLERLQEIRLRPESRLVATHFIASASDFIRAEEDWKSQMYTRVVFVPREDKLELAMMLSEVFRDRDVIEPDDPDLWSSYVSSVKGRLEEIFSVGLAFVLLDESGDFLLSNATDLQPRKPFVADWRTRHFLLVLRHSCFQPNGTGPLHRFDSGCKVAGAELFRMLKSESSGVGVYANALCAVHKAGSEDALDWCEYCFPRPVSGLRVGFSYLESVVPELRKGELSAALGSDKESEFLSGLLSRQLE